MEKETGKCQTEYIKSSYNEVEHVHDGDNNLRRPIESRMEKKMILIQKF